ncbi:hypothetical protein FHS27_002810 [Rhodopirellula rubra]|uniref:Uncharacterized protein n=1 Tax=Aporhodopirellula rubra TaxID=980271 RepID=A0A7W5DYS9_9BACT|nr:hypothetical protein [Aporhodopirellula rubra]MBB3206996.1 hypothetical protein [Aporhodopirellula rubra]
MTNQIETVHGVSYPVVTDSSNSLYGEDSGEPHPVSTQLYRDETAERLIKSTQHAEVKPVKKS